MPKINLDQIKQSVIDEILNSIEFPEIPEEPPGMIRWTASAEAPDGYLIADGSAVSRTEQASLFAEIGTTYGEGDGSTTFNLPNLINRSAIGAGDDYSLGETGGSATHTLTEDEMPVHTHSISSSGNHTHTTSTDGAHTHAPASGTNFYHSGIPVAPLGAGTGAHDFAASAATTGSAGSHSHTISSSGAHTHTPANTGGGEAHNNLPPYIGLTPLIKT